jgi:hypothetical protein
MIKQRARRLDVKIQLLLSLAGLLLVVVLPIFPPAVAEEVSWRKPAIGSIFIIFCSLGVLAVFSPSKCGKILSKRKKASGSESANSAVQGKTVLRGHHPNCGNYEAHIFRINDKTYCAACIGLLVGGLLALAASSLYFFGGWQIEEHGSLPVLLGVAGVGFGLFQFKFRRLIRLAANIVFVFSALLVLVGVDGLVHSLVLDLFVFTLIVFWLYTRILLSQWDHEIICSGCETKNCEFRR